MKRTGIDVASLKYEWSKNVKAGFDEATLSPSGVWMQEGGKQEHILSNWAIYLPTFKYMQRAYPNSEWKWIKNEYNNFW